MMLLFDLAFGIGLLALSAGVGFLIWAYRNNGKCVSLGKVFGYIITLASIFMLLCTLMHGMRGAHMKHEWMKQHQTSSVQQ